MSGTLGLAPGTVKSLNDNFLLPHVSFSRKIDDKSALGLILYGNGGLNTTYPGGGPGTGTFFAGPTGVNLVQIFIAPTYARSFGKRFAAGASLTGSYQAFRATGLANFAPFASNPTGPSLANPGAASSWGIGARLGVLYDASARLTVDAAYQRATSQSKFAKYANLFAGQGAFNIPAVATAGLAWKVTRRWTVVRFVCYRARSRRARPRDDGRSGRYRSWPEPLGSALRWYVR